MSSPAQPPEHIGPLAILAFVAEVLMLIGLAIVGWHLADVTVLSVVLAVALPVAAAAVWGLWCAPRARWRLPTPGRWAVKTALATATFVLLLVVVPGDAATGLGIGMWLLFLVSLPADRTMSTAT
jgi:hypothetical protein